MRFVKALLLCAVLLLMPGCWNRVELNDIAIISAAGVDWKDGVWVLSYQIVIPQSISTQTGESGESPINVFSTQGDNFRIAISKASQETSRRLYFSHNQIVIVGEEAARKGMGPLLEAYLRNHDSRETVNLFLAKGSARHIMEQLTPLEQIPGAAVQRMITNESMNSSSFRQMTVHQVLKELLGGAQSTGIPVLTLAGTGVGTTNIGQLGSTATPSKVRLSELGLISGDKLVGWLSEEQSRGAMWLAGTVKRTTVAFACSNERKGRKKSSARILKAETSHRPEQVNGKWRMNLDVKATGVLLEYNCDDGNLASPEEVIVVQKLIENEIKALMENSWKALRKHNADVIGFGRIIHKRYPQQWKQARGDWRELFAQTELNITVKVKLESTGMSGGNFERAQQKGQ